MTIKKAKKSVSPKKSPMKESLYPNYGESIQYEGEFNAKGERHGEGTLRWDNDGLEYSGQWKNGLRNGFGKFIWNDKEYYEGEYVNNLRQGEGTR